MLDLLKTEAAGYLEAEGMERTYKITQDALGEVLPLQAAKKRFDLRLEAQGSYRVDYTRSGRHLLLAGQRGHVAAVEWETGRLRCEMQLEEGETVRDAKWLNNETLFAVAQRNFVYIYEGAGSEVHRLERHTSVDFLEYLPYHFLLASIGGPGVLRYQDITTGSIVGECQAGAAGTGRCRAMRLNAANGVVHLGHASGQVTLWSPAVSGALVAMQCHRSPVQAVAIDTQGHYMATAGAEGHIKVWDLRTFRRLHQYNPVRPATALDISQQGILAAAYGPHITMWREGLARRAKEPYMHHLVAGHTLASLRFVPYDDVLAAGHCGGIASILVPGAGEPNYDSFEANPFASRTQRREAEVKSLLDKLPAETIMLDPSTIGTVARTSAERAQIKSEASAAAAAAAARPAKKKKLSGKNLRRLKSRQNIIDEAKMRSRELVVAGSAAKNAPAAALLPAKRTALDRFKLKSL